MSTGNTWRTAKLLMQKHQVEGNTTEAQARPSVRIPIVGRWRLTPQSAYRRYVSPPARVLVQWIVLAHIALSSIELKSFQTLSSSLNFRVAEYIRTTGNSIRKLILQEF